MNYVPARFSKLSYRLFNKTIFDNRKVEGEWESVIVVPAIPQFTAAVEEELQMLIGSRRLTSLIGRIYRSGPWGEIRQLRDKRKVSKYEYELKILERIKKSGLGWEGYEQSLSGIIFSPSRIDELQVLMSPSLAQKSDEELQNIVMKMIEDTRANRSLPEPLKDDQLEGYEESFSSRDVRMSQKMKEIIE